MVFLSGLFGTVFDMLDCCIGLRVFITFFRFYACSAAIVRTLL